MRKAVVFCASVSLAALVLACGDDTQATEDDGGTSAGGSGSGGSGGGQGNNNPPIANDDVATTLANTVVQINVLTNDMDPDLGDQLTVTAVTLPATGIATITPGGLVSYGPDTNFTGTDTFMYTVTDVTGLTDEATVTVTVNPLPTLIITSPMDQDTVTGPDIAITFEVTGCTVSSPSSNNTGCHLHKFLNQMAWMDGNGMGFGHYTPSGFTVTGVAAGNHDFALQLIMNDGSDMPFQPLIEDSINIDVQ